jgi:WD40 repeat protein
MFKSNTQNKVQLDYIVIDNILKYYSGNKLKDLSTHIKNKYVERIIKINLINNNYLRNAKYDLKVIETKNFVNGAFIVSNNTFLILYTDKIALCDFYHKDSYLNEKKQITLPIGKGSLVKVSTDIDVLLNSCKYFLISTSKEDLYTNGYLIVTSYNSSLDQVCKISITSEITSGAMNKTHIFIGFKTGLLDIYEINEKKEIKKLIKTLTVDWLNLNLLVFHQKNIITAGSEGEIKLFNTKTLYLQDQFEKEHTYSIIFICSNDTQILSCGTDRYIKIWTLNSRKSIKTIKAFNNLAFKYIFSSLFGIFISSDCTMKIILNDFYSETFEEVNSFKSPIIPHSFDIDDYYSILIIVERYTNKLCFGKIKENS